MTVASLLGLAVLAAGVLLVYGEAQSQSPAASVVSGSGNQPPLIIRLFKC